MEVGYAGRGIRGTRFAMTRIASPGSGRRGFALTVDAVIAMSFILLIFLALSAQRYTNASETAETAFINLHYIAEDTLDVLNKQGVLDTIGELWTSGNDTGAYNLSVLYLDQLIPENMGYSLWIYNNTTSGYTVIADNQRVPDSDTIAQTYALRFLIGYKKGEPVLQSVARAFLTSILSKSTSAYAYFGGFEGQGNLTKYLYVPDGADITEAYMEMDAGSAFNLYVNGQPCDNPHSPSGGYLSADVQDDLSACAFSPGTNTLELEFASGDLTEHYVGGGFVSVTYNTSDLTDTEDTGYARHEFPGIDGIINYFGSFYVPGILENMTAHLVFSNNYTTFMRVGDELVYAADGTGVMQTVDLTDAQLSAMINYNDISGKTVPLRLGTTNISEVIQEGTADVVLITDLSGSMNWRLDNDNTGTTRSCTDANLLTSSTKRVSLAKCLDKQFVNIILNNSGNYVALVGFNTNADNAAYNLDFSSSNTTVINKINTYPDSPSGGTCICCAINKAYEMLAQRETLIDDGEVWKYASYTNDDVVLIADGDNNWKYYSYSGCSDSCNPSTTPARCTPTNWQTTGFNDASWGTANLPKENSNEVNYAFYYRRHFTTSSNDFSSITLNLRNRRGVQCYLNGNLIGTDTSCETGNYWDNEWNVPVGYLNSPGSDNVLACRVRSGSGSRRRGIEFDAELVAELDCGDSCNPTTAPSVCTPTNWYTESFNDSSWGNADLPKTNGNEEYSVFYYRKHFTLDADATGSGFLSVRNRRGVQCYLNGNAVGTDTSCETGNYWDNEWSIPASYFNDAGEDNVLACRLRSGSDYYGREGIEFDALLTTTSGRNKFIVVMSDGVTGHCCGNDGNCDEEGTETSSQYEDCGGGQSDCTGSQCDGAIANAIWSAGRAHTNLSTTVNSVGFGPVSACTNGRYTLQQIAAVGNGTYCASTNATQLRDCYIQFAQDVLEASVRSQVINITGSATLSTLYPSSYLDYYYTPSTPELDYGDITLTYDTERFNDNVTCTGTFYLPEDVTAIDAKATSYSSQHWTDYLEINSAEGYDLSDYGGQYFDFGDPYIVYMDPAHIGSGSNVVYIGTGDSASNETGCSEDNRAILTIKMNGAVGYGDSFPVAEGCNWEIAFEDGTTSNLAIPSDYSGASVCHYVPGNMTTATEDDAANDAVLRVLQKLDLDGDGELDIKFDPNQVEIDSTRVGGVKSLYGPVQFKLVVWI